MQKMFIKVYKRKSMFGCFHLSFKALQVVFTPLSTKHNGKKQPLILEYKDKFHVIKCSAEC
jgi:hypothetical protein